MAPSLRRLMSGRIVGVALAFTLVGAAVGVAAAAVISDPGPFTGCLSAKKGDIYNVAKSATTPVATCGKNDTQITFSNAQGPQGIQGQQGIQGPQGNPGTNGTDGTNGTNGTNGATGAQGPAGAFSTITRTSTDFTGNDYSSGDTLKAFCPSGQQAISGGYEFTGDPVIGQNPNEALWTMRDSLVAALDYQVSPELVVVDSGTVFTYVPAVRVFVNCVPF